MERLKESLRDNKKGDKNILNLKSEEQKKIWNEFLLKSLVLIKLILWILWC